VKKVGINFGGPAGLKSIRFCISMEFGNEVNKITSREKDGKNIQ